MDGKRAKNASQLASLAVALLAAGCGDSPAVSSPAPAERARAVRIETVRTRDVASTLRVSGLVEAEARIELAFRVTGFVDRFEVEEGDRVAAGQVLATLDPRDLAHALRSARAALAHASAAAGDAERSFGRQGKLFEKGTTSRQALDRARSAHEMAQADLAEARVRLEEAEDRRTRATLRAPLPGTIERRLLEPHERALEGAPVLVLTQTDRVKVRAAVADTRVAALRVGARAWVSSPTKPGGRIEGRISRIDLAADRATRTVPFEVAVENGDGALRPEGVVDVEVVTGEPTAHRLVPLASVLRDVDLQPFCFVVEGEGEAAHAVRRDVELDGIHGERVAVASGLADGERLVVRGQHFVRAGDPVRVVEGE